MEAVTAVDEAVSLLEADVAASVVVDVAGMPTLVLPTQCNLWEPSCTP